MCNYSVAGYAQVAVDVPTALRVSIEQILATNRSVQPSVQAV